MSRDWWKNVNLNHASEFWNNVKNWRPRLPQQPDAWDYVKFALKVRKAWKSTLAATISMGLTIFFISYLAQRVIIINTEKTLVSEKRRERQERRRKQFESLLMRIARREVPEDVVEEIVNLKTRELLAKLQSGELDPLLVLTAFQVMAMKAQEATNCLVEPIFQAEEWVEDLKQLSASQRGPLYGLPVSLKENFSLQDYDTTEGCSSLIGSPVSQDCSLVKVLKSLGAVPFVRTNMPQLGFSFESGNPIFGTTLHPLDPARSPGGSTSGEGALIALRGSPLGFGSDSGGSIRCPAAFCGICALKPTSNRLSAKGRPDFNGQTILRSVSGPMAHDVASIVVAMRALCSSSLTHSDDPYCPHLPFNDQIYLSPEPLKIGVLNYDGLCHPVPACSRALKKARLLLEQAGNEVVDWSLPGLSEAFWMSIRAQCGDGGQGIAEALKVDEVQDNLRLQVLAYYVPIWIRRLTAAILSWKRPWFGKMLLSSLGVWSGSDWWELTRNVQILRERVIESWKAEGIHAVITPAFGTPALPLHSGTEALYASSYCMLPSLLDFPAGVVPVDTYTVEDTKDLQDKYIIEFHVQHNIKKKLSSGTEGLPLAVQCLALPWQEEICLRVMHQLYTAAHHK